MESGTFWSCQDSGDSTCKSIRILYALQFGADRENPDDRMLHTFRKFPWAGGWSVVGFYDSLRAAVPKEHRPRIIAIEYSSPGYIELAIVVVVAFKIRQIVDQVCSILERANATYNQIYRDAKERKLLRINVRRAEIKLGYAELKFAEDATGRLAETMGLDLTDELQHLTTNPVVRMKILMSLYRRVRDLSKLQDSEQIFF